MSRIALLLLIAGGIWLARHARQAVARGDMSPQEAARLFGVSPAADRAAILAAHRRLIARVHPDKGGSAELASRVNQARDILLGRGKTE